MTVDGSCCRPTPRGSRSTPSGVARICVSARSIARCSSASSSGAAAGRRPGLAFVPGPPPLLLRERARRVRTSGADRARRRDAGRGSRPTAATARPRPDSDRPRARRAPAPRPRVRGPARVPQASGAAARPSMGPRCQASSGERSDMVCRSYRHARPARPRCRGSRSAKHLSRQTNRSTLPQRGPCSNHRRNPRPQPRAACSSLAPRQRSSTRSARMPVSTMWRLISPRANVTALQQLRGRDYDVVVTDPGTSVVEDIAFTAEIRGIRPARARHRARARAPQADLIAALRAHVFACFAAPFDVEDDRPHAAHGARRGCLARRYRGPLRVAALDHAAGLEPARHGRAADPLHDAVPHGRERRGARHADAGVPRGADERDGAWRRLSPRAGRRGVRRPDAAAPSCTTSEIPEADSARRISSR